MEPQSEENQASSGTRTKPWLRPRGIIIVLGVFILLGAVTTYYEVTKQPTTKASTATGTVRTSPPSINTLVAHIGSELARSFPSLQKETGPDLANTAGFPLSGYNFSIIIPYTVQTSLSLSDNASTNESDQYAAYQKVLPSIESVLYQAGFVALSGNAATNNTFETILFFQRSDADCQLTSYSLLDLACDSQSNLRQIAGAAQPLMAAYQAADPVSGGLTLAAPLITASKSPGYTIAKLPVYGNNGETLVNLYRQTSGAWQVVNLSWYNDPTQDANIQPNCEDFDSVMQIRAAFSGEACYDSATRSMSVID